MHPRPKPSPTSYAERLQEIRNNSRPTLERVESGAFNWRDVAILLDCLQQIGDILDDMAENPPALVPVTSGEDIEKGLQTWKP